MTAALPGPAVVGILYLAGWMALDALGYLFQAGPGISPWYPAHGLSLALLAVFGPRYLPLLVVGPLVNGALFWIGPQWPAVLLGALAITAVYGVAGTFLYCRRLRAPLSSLRDVGLFFGTAFLASIAVALLAAGGLVAGGAVPADEWLALAVLFWAGDSLGLLGMAPLFLVAAAWLRRRLRRPGDPVAGRPASVAAWQGRTGAAADWLFLLAMIVLASHSWSGFPSPPLYLLALPVLWIAYRRGAVSTALAVALASAGPLLLLSLRGAGVELAAIQLKLMTVSIAGIAFAAAVTEGKRRAALLARAEARGAAARMLEEANSRLRERVKEQRCLYRVLELTGDDRLEVEEVCRRTADELCRSLLHDDRSVARLVLGQAEFRSTGWREPVAAMRSRIPIEGEPDGLVELGYHSLAPGLPAGDAAFMPEERDLLQGVARHVARMLKDRRTSERLARSERINAIGRLTGGIAHDFNNLLTVILGNAEALSAALADRPRLHALAEMTAKAAERGADLTGRLLSFARQQALRPGPVDIAGLLHAMKGLLRTATAENIALEIRCEPNLRPALADPAQLEAAVLNICINARDAMPEGGRLRIEASNVRLQHFTTETDDEVRAGDYVMLAITDTGTGMSPEVRARAFEPFFTTKPVGSGSGLGLSMVYGFAVQSGGHVELRSSPGRGSSVILYLPQARAGAAGQAGSDAG